MLPRFAVVAVEFVPRANLSASFFSRLIGRNALDVERERRTLIRSDQFVLAVIFMFQTKQLFRLNRKKNGKSKV